MAVHRAMPCSACIHCRYHCGTCGEPIHRVPGGQGPKWVHTNTGAVAGPGNRVLATTRNTEV